MSVLDSDSTTLAVIIEDPDFDEAQVAAAAFLARYNGRTLDAYRYDLRTFFQWAADAGVAVLGAKRPHIELYRTAMEDKGLAPSTIDRRLSTVCGYYRFAHIDGRISANPAQYIRRPMVHPSEGRGLDRRELGTFLFRAERFDRSHAALAVLLGLNGLRVSEACGTNIEDLAFTQGHRTLRIMGKGSKPAVIPLVPRAARTIDLAIGGFPPRGIPEQIGVHAAVDHGGGRDCVLALVMLCLARKAELAEVTLPDPLEVDGVVRGGARNGDGIRGKLEELFGREGVVPGT